MTSERTKRRRIREEIDSFKISDCELKSDVIPHNVFLNDNLDENYSDTEQNFNGYTPTFKNNNSLINTYSIPDKDNLNCSSLSVNSSPQKCTTFVPITPIDLCSEVKSKLAEWAVRFNVPHNTLNGLLPIFKDIPGLTQIPIDARTILKSNIENKSV